MIKFTIDDRGHVAGLDAEKASPEALETALTQLRCAHSTLGCEIQRIEALRLTKSSQGE